MLWFLLLFAILNITDRYYICQEGNPDIHSELEASLNGSVHGEAGTLGQNSSFREKTSCTCSCLPVIRLLCAAAHRTRGQRWQATAPATNRALPRSAGRASRRSFPTSASSYSTAQRR